MYGRGQKHPLIVKMLAFVTADATVLRRSVAEMASELNVSACHLQHLIKRDLGLSYTAFTRRQRVAVARRVMNENPALTILEVADRCGYEMGTLYRHFIIELSASPSEVRQRDATDNCHEAAR